MKIEGMSTREYYCVRLSARLKSIEADRGNIYQELEKLAKARTMPIAELLACVYRLDNYTKTLKETVRLAEKYYEVIQALDCAVSENGTSADEDTNNGEYYLIPKYND